VVAAAGALWAARIYGRAEAAGRSAHAAKGGWDLEEADGTARQPRGLRFSPAGGRKGQQEEGRDPPLSCAICCGL